LSEVTHSQNRIWNRIEITGMTDTEGVHGWNEGMGATLSTPQACGLVFHHPRQARISQR